MAIPPSPSSTPPSASTSGPTPPPPAATATPREKPTVKAPTNRIYNDSQLHDLFVHITGALMDSGHISVGDSPLTNKIRRFLGTGGQTDQRGHEQGQYHQTAPQYAQPHPTPRVDPSRTRIDARTLKAGLNHFKIDPVAAQKVMDLAKANPNATIIQFIDAVNQAGIKEKGLMTAIMNAHR